MIILFVRGRIGRIIFFMCESKKKCRFFLYLVIMCHNLTKNHFTFAEIINSPFAVAVVGVDFKIMITMEEFFKSLREDFERAQAVWIMNNMDLVCRYVKIKYKILSYLKWWLFCLTVPFQFVKLVVENLKKRSE